MALLGGILLPAPAAAQHEQASPMAGATPWVWTVDGQAFLNGNLQERKFTSFYQVESQNWFMVDGSRRVRSGVLGVDGMFSLEPFTLRRLGSAQVFQTGETLDGAPLIDYQHPHNLLMALDVRGDVAVGRTTVHATAALVGEPALGPAAFMHRLSAIGNPTAPLTHHDLDSTHVTQGVLTVGIQRSVWTFETSRFRGREPDQNRLAVELGRLDSYSGRLSWRRGGWHAQVSAGHLVRPEAVEWTDVTRVTASLDFTGEWRGHGVAWLTAWGRNSGPDHHDAGWLLEGTLHQSVATLWYVRSELVDKEILTAGGLNPQGFIHPHAYSKIGALTLGTERLVHRSKVGQVWVGADLTAYRTPANLLDSYGQPVSGHVFLRFAVRDRQ